MIFTIIYQLVFQNSRLFMYDMLRLLLKSSLKCQPIYSAGNILPLFIHILFEGHFTKARHLKDEGIKSNFLIVWKANNSFIVWCLTIDDDLMISFSFFSLFFWSSVDYLTRDICSKLKLASLLHLGNAENSLNCGFSFRGHSESCKIGPDFSRKISKQWRKMYLQVLWAHHPLVPVTQSRVELMRFKYQRCYGSGMFKIIPLRHPTYIGVDFCVSEDGSGPKFQWFDH